MFSIFKQSSSKILFLVAVTSFCCLSSSTIADTMSLSQTEIEQKIQALPQWEQQDQTLTRTFKFKNFVESVDFVKRLVEPAEAAGHHPDIAISYNRVTISLTTHDAGGLTQKDFDLAKQISLLAD